MVEGLGARVTPGKLGSWVWDSLPTPDFPILSEGVPRKQVQCMLLVQDPHAQFRESYCFGFFDYPFVPSLYPCLFQTGFRPSGGSPELIWRALGVMKAFCSFFCLFVHFVFFKKGSV